MSLEIMAESVATEQHDLSSLTGSPGKRKRDLDSPESQRSKRVAPAANMSVSSADTAAFIESAIEASHSAASASGVSVADFNALQQAASGDQSDATDPSNATSTAQAALGIFPTLHVPPSTEEQFAAQVAADESNGHDNGFHDAQPDGLMDASPGNNSPPANGLQGHRLSGSGSSNPKPTVGSEEWHKMRKDNHKEGKLYDPNLPQSPG